MCFGNTGRLGKSLLNLATFLISLHDLRWRTWCAITVQTLNSRLFTLERQCKGGRELEFCIRTRQLANHIGKLSTKITKLSWYTLGLKLFCSWQWWTKAVWSHVWMEIAVQADVICRTVYSRGLNSLHTIKKQCPENCTELIDTWHMAGAARQVAQWHHNLPWMPILNNWIALLILGQYSYQMKELK